MVNSKVHIEGRRVILTYDGNSYYRDLNQIWSYRSKWIPLDGQDIPKQSALNKIYDEYLKANTHTIFEAVDKLKEKAKQGFKIKIQDIHKISDMDLDDPPYLISRKNNVPRIMYGRIDQCLSLIEQLRQKETEEKKAGSESNPETSAKDSASEISKELPKKPASYSVESIDPSTPAAMNPEQARLYDIIQETLKEQRIFIDNNELIPIDLVKETIYECLAELEPEFGKSSERKKDELFKDVLADTGRMIDKERTNREFNQNKKGLTLDNFILVLDYLARWEYMKDIYTGPSSKEYPDGNKEANEQSFLDKNYNMFIGMMSSIIKAMLNHENLIDYKTQLDFCSPYLFFAVYKDYPKYEKTENIPHKILTDKISKMIKPDNLQLILDLIDEFSDDIKRPLKEEEKDKLNHVLESIKR